jgi:hypothetical protein
LEMDSLELAPTEVVVPPSKTTWAWPQAIMMAGVLIALAGVALSTSFYFHRPRLNPNAPEILRESAGRLTPAQAWVAWEEWERAGLGSVDPRKMQAMTSYRVWMTASIFVTLTGIAVVVLGVVAAKARRRLPGSLARSP